MTGKRFCWSDNITKRLLDICIDEKENGCSKFDWQKIAQDLSVQTQMTFVARQVQNHYLDLKDKYKGWVELRTTMSGIGIHPETIAIRVEETHLESWNAFVEKHRRYAHMFVKKGLPNIEDLDMLFAGKTANGERGFSTAMARSKRVMDFDNLDGKGVNVGIEKLTSTRKRKNKDGADQVVENKQKPPTIDSVLEFLSKTVASPNVSKTKRVSFALRDMGVSKDRGDRYFVDATRYLGEGNNGDIFPALENDTQKWISWKMELLHVKPSTTLFLMDDDVRRACMIVGLEQMRRLLQPSIESGPTSQPQPQRYGGKTGAEYINRILNGRPDLCKEQLRLLRDMFLKLVDLMVARKLLSDGRFIKMIVLGH
ncbi:hypothetical protein OROMI_019093 [Orobanche minor]